MAHSTQTTPLQHALALLLLLRQHALQHTGQPSSNSSSRVRPAALTVSCLDASTAAAALCSSGLTPACLRSQTGCFWTAMLLQGASSSSSQTQAVQHGNHRAGPPAAATTPTWYVCVVQQAGHCHTAGGLPLLLVLTAVMMLLCCWMMLLRCWMTWRMKMGPVLQQLAGLSTARPHRAPPCLLS